MTPAIANTARSDPGSIRPLTICNSAMPVIAMVAKPVRNVGMALTTSIRSATRCSDSTCLLIAATPRAMIASSAPAALTDSICDKADAMVEPASIVSTRTFAASSLALSREKCSAIPVRTAMTMAVRPISGSIITNAIPATIPVIAATPTVSASVETLILMASMIRARWAMEAAPRWA